MPGLVMFAIQKSDSMVSVRSDPDLACFDSNSSDRLYSDPLFLSPLTPPSVVVTNHHTWDGKPPTPTYNAKPQHEKMWEAFVAGVATAICGPSIAEEALERKVKTRQRHRRRHKNRYKHRRASIRYYYIKPKFSAGAMKLHTPHSDRVSPVTVAALIDCEHQEEKEYKQEQRKRLEKAFSGEEL